MRHRNCFRIIMNIEKIFILLLLTFAAASCTLDPNDREYRVDYGDVLFSETTEEMEYSIVDLNGDGVSEIVRKTYNPTGEVPKYLYVIFDNEGLHINTFVFNYSSPIMNFYDINNDGVKELLLTYRENTDIFITAINAFDKKVYFKKKIETVKLKPRENKLTWHGSLEVMAVTDLNGDGYSEIFIKVKGQYAVYPREVVAYDFHNDRILWKYKHASIQILTVDDINNDGRKEIFISTTSPGNGTVYDNSDDYHTYFVILDENGKEIINRLEGEENSRFDIILHDFDNDGKKELITLLTTGNHDPQKQKHSITKWDYAEFPNLKAEIRDTIKFYNGQYQIAQYRNKDRLCMLDNRGLINILDENFNVIKVIPYNAKILAFKGKMDLNNDGTEENIWTTKKDNSLLVFNDEFKLLIAIPNTARIFSLKNGKNKPPDIVLQNMKKKLTKIKLTTFIPPEKKIELLIKNSLLALSVILVLYLAYYLLHGSWKWYGKQLVSFQSGRSAMLAVDGKGRIVFANDKCDDIFNRSVNSMKWKDVAELFSGPFSSVWEWYQKQGDVKKEDAKNILVGVGQKQKEYNFTLKFIRSKLRGVNGALILIDDVTPLMQSKRTDVWLTVAQKFAHEIKTPLTSILLTLQKIRMDFENNEELKRNYEKTIKRSLDDVALLKKVVDEFLGFSSVEKFNPEPTNIIEIINKLYNRYKLRIPEDAKLIKEIEEDIPAIIADETHISTALSILLDNAIEALGEKGKIVIKVEMTKERFVRITVEDNGCGIAEEDIPKLFNLFYTTKEGGAGLGLIIAKRIIDDHNGSIEIKSKKGKGTAIIISLPLEDHS